MIDAEQVQQLGLYLTMASCLATAMLSWTGLIDWFSRRRLDWPFMALMVAGFWLYTIGALINDAETRGTKIAVLLGSPVTLALTVVIVGYVVVGRRRARQRETWLRRFEDARTKED